MTSKRSDTARRFRELHQEGLLVLPNAWDAGSARLIEKLGAKAIATTSAGVAWSHGYADGDLLPVPLLAETVAEIARVVGVPVSADVEGGYSSDPASVGEVVAAVIDSGAVGINIEDGTGGADLLCAKVEEAKRAGVRLGVDLFVNARADVYLRDLVTADRRLDETLARAERYRAAGADGIFVPGVTDASDIRAIASAVRLPLNVLARPGLPPAPELQALGVRRLSAGSWIAAAAFARTALRASEFLRAGASDPLAKGAMPYAEINSLMADRR
ncbi:MAG: isocitrate lyase/phosphoenolpyruvate mutase family protein [Acidobacteriota bacterium]|nr:isocitrate lyase/phosphoenolpyruvate mutase family protein [Acidobacteriota bacterium]